MAKDKNRFEAFRDIGNEAKDDAISTVKLLNALVFLLIALGVLSSLWYFWYRNIGSNQERDAALNSGRREFTELVNLGNIVTQCEAQKVKIAALQAELNQYNPETQTAAYNMAQQNLLGTQTFFAECNGKINTILQTVELEGVPEYENGLKRRVEALLAE